MPSPEAPINPDFDLHANAAEKCREDIWAYTAFLASLDPDDQSRQQVLTLISIYQKSLKYHESRLRTMPIPEELLFNTEPDPEPAASVSFWHRLGQKTLKCVEYLGQGTPYPHY